MPFPFQPMTLSRRLEPFNHPDWLFEIKHDGFRALAYVQGNQCQLVSRRGNVYKRFLPLPEQMAKELKVKSAVLDGEIVCLDAIIMAGVSSTHCSSTEGRRTSTPSTFCN